MTKMTHNAIGTEILITEATRLFNESQQVPTVISTGTHNGTRESEYILRQGVIKPSDFQLPEPILQPIISPQILVVGYYPNYGEDEDIPRYGCSLDEYISFYVDRFSEERRDAQGRPAHKRLSDGRIVSISHYHVVEQLIDNTIGQRHSLGTLAVYCDALPWKFKPDPAKPTRWTGVDGGIAFHRLDRIISALKPRVVLTLGSVSKAVLVHKQRQPGMTNGRLPTPLVTSHHPNARGGLFARNSCEVQAQLARSLSTSHIGTELKRSL